ncbi:MAG: NADH dehydrogenase subunit, partial [Bdellovibrionota bacterium]
LREMTSNAKQVALVLTGQYSVEEYEALVGYFKNEIGTEKIFHWINNPDSVDKFDGLLYRGDQNPNTKGLIEVLGKHGISTHWRDLTEGLSTGAIRTVVVAGPENQAAFPDIKAKIMELSKAAKLIWMQAGKNDQLEQLEGDVTLIPLKTYVEKDGTFVNYAGIRQTVKKGVSVVPHALSLTEVTALFRGDDVLPEIAHDLVGQGRIHNEFTLVRGNL